jgi:hypothetical protein
MKVARAHAGVNANLLDDIELLDRLSGNAVFNGIPVEVVALGAVGGKAEHAVVNVAK